MLLAALWLLSNIIFVSNQIQVIALNWAVQLAIQESKYDFPVRTGT